MPGDTGDNEWDGFLPRAQIPQAHNPEQGYIITANADPTGVSFDNNPFNDGPYIGYTWDVGYRVTEITTRMQALIARSAQNHAVGHAGAAGRPSLEPGAEVAPVIVQAINEAASADERVSALVTPEVQAAADYLRDWADSGYLAHEGVGDGVSEANKKASVATSIFNTMLPFLLKNALGDEKNFGLDVLGLSSTGRFLKRLMVAPETMAVGADGVAAIWDDSTTADVVETRAEIVAALAQTIAWAPDPAKVGIAAAGYFSARQT